LASFHGKCLLRLQEKSIDLLKSLVIILPQNAKEVSKINVLQINQQTLFRISKGYFSVAHF